MADAAPVVHIGENSPQKVAYVLLTDIAKIEGKVFHRNPGEGYETATRKWLLDTFGECLFAANGYRCAATIKVREQRQSG